ncbi:FtsX-like permease family protein [Microbispora sp. ZYX-F-249]|uniref:FtsX-like permease family protein n=1 Tax=Microbispora maris TaxID=3144104 RepID=A0ABV0AIP5_9ACTN
MLGVAWRTLRRQPGTLAGAFLMIVIGAGLISAFSVIQGSAARSEAPVERYAAVPVVAGGAPGLFTAEAVKSVEALPGVREVVPELTFTAVVLNRQGQPALDPATIAQFGHGWTSAKLTPFSLIEGRSPGSDDEVVLDRTWAEAAAVSPGGRVTVLVAGIPREYRVAGIAEPDRAAPLRYQRTLFFTPAQAAKAAAHGAGRADGLGVFVTPGADPAAVEARVRAALAGEIRGDTPGPADLPTLRVASGTARGALEASLPDDRTTAQTMGMLMVIVAFMAITVISGALITSVRRRARQLALLRAIGATPGQIRLLCLAEALLLGVLGALTGSALGLVLAEVLAVALRSRGIFNPAFRVVYDLRPIALAVLIAVLASQVAAWFAARAALKIRPAEALTNAFASIGRRGGVRTRVVLGLLSLAGAGGIQVLGMAGLMPPALRGVYGVAASGLVMIGIGLIGSWIVFGMAFLARVPVGALSPVSGYLAAANTRFQHRRYAGVVAPLAVGVAIAGWALSSLPLYTLSTTAEAAARIDADYIVRTPLVRDTYIGLDEEFRKRAAAVPGVTATAGLWDAWAQATSLRQGSDRSVQNAASTYATVATGAPSRLLDLQVLQGDLAKVDAGLGAAVGASYARQRGIALGDQVEVRITGASSPVVLPVAAVFGLDKGGQEGLVLPGRALAAHMAEVPYNRILVGTGSGARPDVRRALEDIAGTTTIVKVEDKKEFQQEYVRERSANTSNIGILAVVLVGGFLLLAAVSALVLSAADRAAEFTSLRQVSALPAQITLMIVWEMVLTVVPAWLLGVAATVWMAFLMSGGDAGATVRALPLAAFAAFGVLALVTAIVGCLITARSAMRGTDKEATI